MGAGLYSSYHNSHSPQPFLNHLQPMTQKGPARHPAGQRRFDNVLWDLCRGWALSLTPWTCDCAKNSFLAFSNGTNEWVPRDAINLLTKWATPLKVRDQNMWMWNSTAKLILTTGTCSLPRQPCASEAEGEGLWGGAWETSRWWTSSGHAYFFPMFILCLVHKGASEGLLLDANSCAWCTVRPNKLKRQSLEQRKVNCRAMQGDGCLVPKKSWSPWSVSAKHF